MATSLGKVGIVDRGNYLQEEIYNAGDFVLYNGSTWIALKDGILGVEPAEGTEWKYLARGFEAEVLSLITANDTSGLIGEEGQQVNAQSLIDIIADKVANRLLDKGLIANNLVTDNTEMVLAAPMGKELKRQLDEQNKNIDGKATGSYKFHGVNGGLGWYRFAKLSNESNGASGSSVMFVIKTYFNNSGNMSVIGVLNTGYETGNITILGDSIYNHTVSNIRYAVDKSNNCSYLEFYYNTSVINGISIDLIGSKVSIDGEWKLLDTLEKTEETASNVTIRSSANLIKKENYVVKNSDLKNYVSIIDNGGFGISKTSQQYDAYSSGIQFSINNGDKLLQLEITTSNQLMGRCKWVHASDWSSWKQLI